MTSTPTAIYRAITGDQATHHRTITAELGREPKRRRQLVQLYAEGLSDRQVAEVLAISHGTARGTLRRTMQALHRRIHHTPRYHRVGRASGYTVSQNPRPRPQKATDHPDPRGYRRYLTAAEEARA
jgi:hypothetical protein